MTALQYWYRRLYAFYSLNKKIYCKTVGHAEGQKPRLPLYSNYWSQETASMDELSPHESILQPSRNVETALHTSHKVFCREEAGAANTKHTSSHT